MAKQIWWREIKFVSVDMTLHYDAKEQRFRFPAKRCFMFRFFGCNGIVFYGKNTAEVKNEYQTGKPMARKTSAT